MSKETIRIADAIPEPPVSYYRTVEAALQKAAEKEQRSDRVTIAEVGTRRIRLKKRALAVLVAAAVLLVATTAVAASALLSRERYTPANYLDQNAEQRVQPENVIPDVENVIAAADPKADVFSVTMLPEMPDADKLNAGRQQMGQPAYDEAAWGWIREIRPEILDVLYADGTLAYNIRLHTPNGLRFVKEDGGQWLSAFSEETTFTAGGTSVSGFASSDTIDESADETGVTIHSAFEDGANAIDSLPKSGTVTVTDTIGIYDCKVDDMGHIGLLATITYTFTFEADTGAQDASVTVTERALSGRVTLSIERPDNRYVNMPADLSGVVLEETVDCRTTGVYVTYRIRSAPDSWTEEMLAALLSPSFESPQFAGFSAMYVADRSDPGCVPVRPEHADGKKGEITLILPVFPSDYDRVRQTGYGLELGFRCIDSFEEKPVGESWSGQPTDPEEGWDIGSREQPLLSVMLPLPNER